MGFPNFHPSSINTFQTIPNFLLLTHKTRKLHALKLKHKKPNTYQLLLQTIHIPNTSSHNPQSTYGAPFTATRCKGKNTQGTTDGDAECRALETVLKLYSAIKNRDLQELSDVIGEECRCMSNFVLAFKPLQGKQQVLEFFATLMSVMGKHVEFVIQPTLDDGTNVGLQWTLACSKTHAPLGKGFSFYTAHSYRGKFVIRNVEMFMEPILHIEPLRLKLIGVLSQVIAEIGRLYKKKMNGYLLLFISLLLMAVSLFFLKLSLR